MISAIILAGLIVEWALYLEVGAALAQRHGQPVTLAVAAAVAVFLGVRFAVIALQYALASRHRPAGRRRRSGRESVGAVFREVGTVLAVFTWDQLLQRFLSPRDPPSVVPGAFPPVLLVHGIFCNAGVWRRMRRYLGTRGIDNLFAINLEPPLAGIDDFAVTLAERVEEVRRRTGADKVVLVAHSMGGLVSRAYIARLGGAQRVERLVTIGSPHHGSEMARLAIGRCARDMIPNGPWLSGLVAAEAGSPGVPVTTIFSWDDNMVAPQDSPRLPGARAIALENVGHLELLRSPEVMGLVAGEISDARAATSP
jgi:pimeloyl-ACP methyl ester carboxylesterase